MSIDKFMHRRRFPNAPAVRWTGDNKEEILEFVQLVVLGYMGWDDRYDIPRHLVAFSQEDDDDGDDPYNMVVFEHGLEVDEGQWIVMIETSDDIELLEFDHTDFLASWGRQD